MDAIQRQPQQSEANIASLLDGYLTREALAAQLQKSVRTIDRWETRRVGPPRVRVGRLILFRVQSVREWLESHEQPHGKRATRGRGSR
jgi:predicted DNA-binding transcriptional regulator AlpA